MTKIKIKDATKKQLDYAAAMAHEWIKDGETWRDPNTRESIFDCFVPYRPTTNQAHCGELLDEFGISTEKSLTDWNAYVLGFGCIVYRDKSRLVAAVQAFLWSKNPSGMIEVE